jgi:hypothetical protein
MRGRERQIVFITTKSQSICSLVNGALEKQTGGNWFGFFQCRKFLLRLSTCIILDCASWFDGNSRSKGFLLPPWKCFIAQFVGLFLLSPICLAWF